MLLCRCRRPASILLAAQIQVASFRYWHLRTCFPFSLVLSKESQLHLLFNNAGVMAPPANMQTKQGYELQLGVNVVGPFLLTKLLLPILERTASSLKRGPSSPKDHNIVRVINTSSYGHSHFAPPSGFNFGNPNHPPGDTWVSYGQSKWANVVVANEIARRYGGKGISAHSLNPGTIKTNLAQHSSWFAKVFFVRTCHKCKALLACH
jgi:retinol dehydrogenase-12